MSQEGAHRIEFLKTRPCFGKDGNPVAQTAYLYRVDGDMTVSVLVHLHAVMTLDGSILSRDQIVVAGKTLIEMEIKNNVDLRNIGEGLVLDYGAMFHISYRLGWRDRFHKSAKA